MTSGLEKIIANVLTALYQPFWFSILLSIMAMFFYLYSTDSENAGKGFKKSMKIFLSRFKSDIKFRRLYYLLFYTTMILFRTLLNRSMWMNPVSNVMGGWWIYKIDSVTGEQIFATECIENLILFVPFTYLLLFFVSGKKAYSIRKVTSYAFLFSLGIEFIQLFLRLGTFQIADLFYNSVGGFLGAILYYVRMNMRTDNHYIAGEEVSLDEDNNKS